MLVFAHKAFWPSHSSLGKNNHAKLLKPLCVLMIYCVSIIIHLNYFQETTCYVKKVCFNDWLFPLTMSFIAITIQMLV